MVLNSLTIISVVFINFIVHPKASSNLSRSLPPPGQGLCNSFWLQSDLCGDPEGVWSADIEQVSLF